MYARSDTCRRATLTSVDNPLAGQPALEQPRGTRTSHLASQILMYKKARKKERKRGRGHVTNENHNELSKGQKIRRGNEVGESGFRVEICVRCSNVINHNWINTILSYHFLRCETHSTLMKYRKPNSSSIVWHDLDCTRFETSDFIFLANFSLISYLTQCWVSKYGIWIMEYGVNGIQRTKPLSREIVECGWGTFAFNFS